MRKVGAVVCLVVSVVVAALTALLAFGLTSEYGASPNGDLVGDLRRSVGSLTPVLVVIGVLVWLGLAGVVDGLDGRTRGAGAAGAALVTVVAVLVAIALGQGALESRCDRDGADHSAACPGFSGPLEEVCDPVTGECREVEPGGT